MHIAQRSSPFDNLVGDLEFRAARLRERGRFTEAQTLDEAAQRGAGGVRQPLSNDTVLARAAQSLARAKGNRAVAIEVAESTGDDVTAAVLRAAASATDTSATAVAPIVLGPLISALTARSLFVKHVLARSLPPGVAGIRLPRLDTGVPPAWVAEGGAIPVMAGATGTGVTLQPKKLASIVVATSELATRTVFAPLLQEYMIRRLGVAIDSRFFASTQLSNAPDGAFFAGSGVAVTADAGTNATAAARDFGALIEAAELAGVDLADASFVIHPTTMAKLGATVTTGGQMPFIGVREFAGVPIETSAGVPVGRVGLVAWSEVAGVSEGMPTVDVSAGATLHMEDTSPNADFSVPASGGKSLFQTDEVGILVRFPIGWASLHAAGAHYVDNVAWD